ncbi:alpha/beta hydrolase [Actinoplanes sp. NPDC023714]|uniref:alpha/beta hydrolase n=1 Tax=Actinoplanes sp. NPDC023714 TaxID=3154322 RepID=UPI003409F52F
MLTGILVPGRAYDTEAPLFDIADFVLTARGHRIERIGWTVPPALLEIGPEPFVRAHVTAALHTARADAPSARPVLIAKSLGSYAAALAAEQRLPAIWLTPLLYEPAVVAAITANPAPQLLVGGTEDFAWKPEQANATGKRLLEIPGADHSLRVPGPVSAYTDVLAEVGAAMERFLGSLE